MTENQAWNLLVDLLAHKGQLKVITSHLSELAKESLRLEEEGKPPLITQFNPAYHVQHDVVKIEVKKISGKPDRLWAYTEEGDICEAMPLALLSRLTEHNVGLSNTGS